jgi:hypothetical protein
VVEEAARVRAWLCKLQKGCTPRLAVASDKAYQLLAHGRWFSLDTPASVTMSIFTCFVDTKLQKNIISGLKYH